MTDSYQKMVVLPKRIFDTWLTHKDERVREGALSIHVRQLNNFNNSRAAVQANDPIGSTTRQKIPSGGVVNMGAARPTNANSLPPTATNLQQQRQDVPLSGQTVGRLLSVPLSGQTAASETTGGGLEASASEMTGGGFSGGSTGNTTEAAASVPSLRELSSKVIQSQKLTNMETAPSEINLPNIGQTSTDTYANLGQTESPVVANLGQSGPAIRNEGQVEAVKLSNVVSKRVHFAAEPASDDNPSLSRAENPRESQASGSGSLATNITSNPFEAASLTDTQNVIVTPVTTPSAQIKFPSPNPASSLRAGGKWISSATRLHNPNAYNRITRGYLRGQNSLAGKKNIFPSPASEELTIFNDGDNPPSPPEEVPATSTSQPREVEQEDFLTQWERRKRELEQQKKARQQAGVLPEQIPSTSTSQPVEVEQEDVIIRGRKRKHEVEQEEATKQARVLPEWMLKKPDRILPPWMLKNAPDVTTERRKRKQKRQKIVFPSPAEVVSSSLPAEIEQDLGSEDLAAAVAVASLIEAEGIEPASDVLPILRQVSTLKDMAKKAMQQREGYVPSMRQLALAARNLRRGESVKSLQDLDDLRADELPAFQAAQIAEKVVPWQAPPPILKVAQKRRVEEEEVLAEEAEPIKRYRQARVLPDWMLKPTRVLPPWMHDNLALKRSGKWRPIAKKISPLKAKTSTMSEDELPQRNKRIRRRPQRLGLDDYDEPMLTVKKRAASGSLGALPKKLLNLEGQSTKRKRGRPIIFEEDELMPAGRKGKRAAPASSRSGAPPKKLINLEGQPARRKRGRPIIFDEDESMSAGRKGKRAAPASSSVPSKKPLKMEGLFTPEEYRK